MMSRKNRNKPSKKQRAAVSPFTQDGAGLAAMHETSSGKAFAGTAAAPSQQALEKKPPIGEETPQQVRMPNSRTANGMGGLAVFTTANEAGVGKPPPGTYATYRKMRNNPTIAMANVASFAPITTASFTVKGDENATDEQIEFIDKQMRPLWPLLIVDALRAVEYGFQAFEKVFEVRDVEIGGKKSPRFTLRKLKPLWPDMTNPIIDPDIGTFMGIEQNNTAGSEASVRLPAEKSFWYVYDMEAGNWYGRSRYENIRTSAWIHWQSTADKLGQYGKKIAGVIPIIMYPEGQSRDASGGTVDNYDIAVKMLKTLGGQMEGFAMPNALASWAGDLMQRGVNPDQLRPWLIQFLESKGNHGGDFVTTMRYWDTQIARGLFTPERSFQEGQHGTKAEAGEMVDIVLMIAEQTYADIVRFVNWYIVNQLVALNFADAEANSVYIEPGPIIDADRAWLRKIIEEALKGSMAAEMWPRIDIEGILDHAGIPALSSEEQEAAVEEALQQRQAMQQAFQQMAGQSGQEDDESDTDDPGSEENDDDSGD